MAQDLFIAGLGLGVFGVLMVFALALCQVASDADDMWEEM